MQDVRFQSASFLIFLHTRVDCQDLAKVQHVHKFNLSGSKHHSIKYQSFQSIGILNIKTYCIMHYFKYIHCHICIYAMKDFVGAFYDDENRFAFYVVPELHNHFYLSRDLYLFTSFMSGDHIKNLCYSSPEEKFIQKGLNLDVLFGIHTIFFNV